MYRESSLLLLPCYTAQFQQSFDCPSCSFASLASSSGLVSSSSSRICSCFSDNAMEALDDCKWRQIPAFGDWNMWEDMPVTQYFQSGAFFFAAQADKEEEDLFKVPQFTAKPYNYKKCVVRVKGEKASDVPVKKGGRRQYVKEQQKWKPKGAVDEDLYKISPQLLCKKKYLRNLLGGCLGLNCIA
ncbi:hypothetical protein EJB05_17978, partial [Eragrostis curvula]